MKKQHRKQICKLGAGIAISLLALAQGVSAQTPVDASNGIDFGTGSDDPHMKKGVGNTDLQVEVEDGSGLSIYSGSNTKPTFLAGQGNEGSVVANKWYRIAKSNGAGKRANALFILNDDINGGGHSTAVFRAGISYSDTSSMGVTLLSHTHYYSPSFTKVRILENSTYDEFYLEVWMNRPGPVRYSIADNLASGGWAPVDWVETPSIPSGYVSHEFNINKLFTVGRTSNILSVNYDGSVEIDGPLNVLASPVITQATAPSLLAGQFVKNQSGATGASAVSLGHPSWATGESSTTIGKYTTASGSSSIAMGDGTTASGFAATAMGNNTTASGHSAFASGNYSTASGDSSFAFSGGAANGFSSAAGLNGTTASGASESIALGAYSQTNNMHSVALGMGSATYGDLAVAIAGAHSYAYRSVATGINNPRYTSAGQTAWQGDDQNSAFEIGIGDWGNAKNGLTVLQDGSVEVGKATATDNSVPLHVKANGDVVLSKAQGDISMGDFGN